LTFMCFIQSFCYFLHHIKTCGDDTEL
jgi:hypothetical protein